MKIDRNYFRKYFPVNGIPFWNCSTCNIGKLVFQISNITIQETNKSISDSKEEEYFDYTFVKKHFHGKIQCNNPKCNEVFTFAGEAIIDVEYDNRGQEYYIDHISPKFFYPTLNIFQIPEETPFEVEEEILRAFKLYWIDESACANAIRSIVEDILDDKRVRKTIIDTNGKRKGLTLHRRIELFGDKNLEVADYLMAIKWIGNYGSHIGEVYSDDLLDAFEMLNHTIEKLYGDHEYEIASMRKRINKIRRPLN